MSTPIPPGVPSPDTVRAPAPDLQEEARRLAERVHREVSAAVAPERIDSELSLLNRFAEHEDVDVVLGPVLAQVLAAALRTTRLTSGLVDPTTGDAAWRAQDGLPARPAPGIAHLDLDLPARRLRMRQGTVLDLTEVAEAWTADRTALLFAETFPGQGLVVRAGGVLAVAGPPAGAGRGPAPDPALDAAAWTALLAAGHRGLAVLPRPGATVVNPVTGAAAESPWDRVAVAARTAVEAQAYARAAHVLGTDAPGWVAACGAEGEFTGSRPGSTLRRRLRTPGWPGRTGRAAA